MPPLIIQPRLTPQESHQDTEQVLQLYRGSEQACDRDTDRPHHIQNCSGDGGISEILSGVE